MMISTRRIARLLYPVTLVFLCTLIVGPIGFLFLSGLDQSTLLTNFPNIAVRQELPLDILAIVAALGFVPLFVLVYVIWCLSRLFQVMGSGQLISDQIAGWLKHIGLGFLATAVTGILIYPVQTVLLTSYNPPGQKALAFSLDSEQIVFVLVGFLIYVLGHATREAAELATENKAFV